MSQSEVFHETWAYLRDNAKPIVPDDVWDLRAVRDMGPPPSKAHRKRIARKSKAPTVTTAKPVVPNPAIAASRRRHNEAVQHGQAIAKLLGYTKPIVR